MNRAVPIRYVWYVYTSARAQLQSDSLRISKNNSHFGGRVPTSNQPPEQTPSSQPRARAAQGRI